MVMTKEQKALLERYSNNPVMPSVDEKLPPETDATVLSKPTTLNPRQIELLNGAPGVSPEDIEVIGHLTGTTEKHKGVEKSGYAEGIARAVGQGITRGWADEGEAGIRSFFGDSDYTSEQKRISDKIARFTDEEPLAAVTSETIAAAVPEVALAFLTKGRSLGTTTAAKEAIISGADNFVYGGGSATPGQRIEGAMLGGGIGVVAPTVTRPMVRALSGTIKAGKRAADRTGVTEAVNSIRGKINVPMNEMTKKINALSGPGRKLLMETLRADKRPGVTGLENPSQYSMPMDVGPASMKQVDIAVQASPPAASVVRENVGKRVTDTTNDLTDEMNLGMGKPGESQSMAVVDPRDPNPFKSLYDRAYAEPIDYTSADGVALEKMILTRMPPEAIKKANALMRVDGIRSKQIAADEAEDGTVTFRMQPDVTQVDYMTRALNLMSESGEGAGVMGGQTQLGTAYQGLSREVRNLTKKLVPKYGNALNAAADKITARNAKKVGYMIVTNSKTREEFAGLLEGMGEAEKRKVVEGFRQNIDDVQATVKTALTDPNLDAREALQLTKDLSSRNSREKMEVLFGPEEAKRLTDKLDETYNAFSAQASYSGNSATMARLRGELAVDEAKESIVNSFRRGEPLNAGKKTWQNLTGATDADQRARSDRLYTEVATFLTNPAGKNSSLLIERMEQIGLAEEMIDTVAKMMMRATLTNPATLNRVSKDPALSSAYGAAGSVTENIAAPSTILEALRETPDVMRNYIRRTN